MRVLSDNRVAIWRGRRAVKRTSNGEVRSRFGVFGPFGLGASRLARCLVLRLGSCFVGHCCFPEVVKVFECLDGALAFGPTYVVVIDFITRRVSGSSIS